MTNKTREKLWEVFNKLSGDEAEVLSNMLKNYKKVASRLGIKPADVLEWIRDMLLRLQYL
jgi:hypothetical protein